MALNIKSEVTFSFSNENWLFLDSLPSNYPEFTQISIGCYNVLFSSKSFLRKTITSDHDRYLYQIDELLPKLDLDVIALSEVKKEYIEMLLQRKWVKENYYVFNPKKPVFKNFFGNLILSRFPMRCYSMDNLIYGRIALALIIPPNSKKNSSFLILSVHLIAYEKNYNMRKKQLDNILKGLNSYANKDDPYYESFKSAVSSKNIIIMGDLNFHLKSEDQRLVENDLIDFWIETNKSEGYSWDSTKNGLIQLMLPFDNRRMRLDRILMTEGSKLFRKIPGENKKVFPHKKISYLMGSDHFGLKFKVGLNENPEDDTMIVGKTKIIFNQEYFEKLPKHDGFRSERAIIVYRVIVVLILCLVLGYIAFKLFYAFV